MQSRILVVEDNSTIAKLFVHVLTTAGHDAHAVGDAYEALSYLNSSGNGVALILADMVLPALDGFEFVRQVKAKPSLAHIPIIAITALSNPDHQRQALDAGCAAFVMKPTTLRHLLEVVRGYLPKNEGT